MYVFFMFPRAVQEKMGRGKSLSVYDGRCWPVVSYTLLTPSKRLNNDDQSFRLNLLCLPHSPSPAPKHSHLF